MFAAANLSHFRFSGNGKLPGSRGALRKGRRNVDILLLEMFHDHVDRSIDRPLIVLDHLERPFSKLVASRRILEKFAKSLLQALLVAHLDGAACPQEGFGDTREVLHVRAEDNGLPQGGWFDRILASLASETLSHKDSRCRPVEVAQFAGRIDKQTIGFTGAQGCIGADFGAIHELQSGSLDVAARFLASLEVSGHNDQEKIWKVLPQAPAYPRQDGLLARMRASSNDDRPMGINRQLLQECWHVDGRLLRNNRSIKFQVAHHAHGFGPGSKLQQTLLVYLILDAYASERPKEGTKEKPQPSIAPIRALR